MFYYCILIKPVIQYTSLYDNGHSYKSGRELI